MAGPGDLPGRLVGCATGRRCATESGGLPDWTPTMALVVLLMGLPMCLATAFVQEGMPGRQAGDEGTPPGERPAGPEEAEPHIAAGTGSLDRGTRASGTSRIFTWRNAFLGGVGAAVLLVLSLSAYFVMWSTGIGPAGNLIAQGVIAEGERVILADFTDGTGEGYADPITEALRIDLLEAAVFQVVDESEIRPVLGLNAARARRRPDSRPGTRRGRTPRRRSRAGGRSHVAGDRLHPDSNVQGEWRAAVRTQASELRRGGRTSSSMPPTSCPRTSVGNRESRCG